MALPCLIPLKTRAVLVRTQTNTDTGETGLGQADYINVTGVQLEHVATQVERSDVYSPSGAGMPALTAGRNWQFTITQELYLTDVDGVIGSWDHAALFRAAPVKLTADALAGKVIIQPATGTCRGTDVSPVTVEIIEQGGNRYRSINAIVTQIEIAADPQQRVMITWTLYGDFVAPVDATATSFVPAATLPVMYRAAVIQWDGDALATTCPAFSWSSGMAQDLIESACADGGNFAVGSLDVPPSLSFSGAAAVKESILPAWDMMTSAEQKALALSIQSGDVIFKFTPGQLVSVGLGELQRYVGYDLSFEAAGAWSIEIGGYANA